MRQYQLKETKEITKIICNRCGKETKAVSYTHLTLPTNREV